jgi:glycerol kinase
MCACFCILLACPALHYNTTVHATDVSNASRTMLMDLSTLQWSPALLAACGDIPAAMLPAIHPSSCLEFGAVTSPDVPSLAGVRIGGVLGDQQAALFGQCCFHAGDAKATYGTGCFVLRNTGTSAIQSGGY